ncbi:hypothetical protein [Streptomyces sp. NPDC005989]
MEPGRRGNGVVGRDIKGDEVVSGLNRQAFEDDVVRAPLSRA